jgi:hypothetical protein
MVINTRDIKMTERPKRYLTQNVKDRIVSEHMRDLALRRSEVLTSEERRAIALKASKAAADVRKRKAEQRSRDAGNE